MLAPVNVLPAQLTIRHLPCVPLSSRHRPKRDTDTSRLLLRTLQPDFSTRIPTAHSHLACVITTQACSRSSSAASLASYGFDAALCQYRVSDDMSHSLPIISSEVPTSSPVVRTSVRAPWKRERTGDLRLARARASSVHCGDACKGRASGFVVTEIRPSA